jgi:uncharacterized protein (TIGR01319 family)
MVENKLLVDVGSTYFKVCANGTVEQHFRDFNKDIYDDLTSKCGDTITSFDKENVYICSSANGGLTTLIIGITNNFSLKFATNIAYNSGINIINTILYQDIEEASIPSEQIDVVILVGGIDSINNVFDDRLYNFIENLNYSNVVFAGTKQDADTLNAKIENLVVVDNIINNKLHVVEEPLKNYLTNLYQSNIMGKEDIKHLYDLTSNQIYSTPYIVNKTLPLIDAKFAAVNPLVLIDIGGATTDIHYSKDLSYDNMVTQNEYDRLVFKKLGVFKSKESLIFAAKNNEFVYELLAHLKVTENIFNEESSKATRILMQLAIFLVLYKVSEAHPQYIKLKLNLLKSIVLTGGITKVLSFEETEDIISFFYKKILSSDIHPSIILDSNYDIWTLGITQQ